MGNLVLSLFPGIGLLDMALEEEGFCVVRGPDLLWGGNIKTFHPPAGRFDGVIGGPPCKPFSDLANYGVANTENLIPEFERVVLEAQPDWFVMENVRRAPLPAVDGYIVKDILLNNRALGEKQRRIRRFSFGTRTGLNLIIPSDMLTIFDHPEFEYCVTAHDHTGGNWPGSNRGKGRSIQQMIDLQGLPPGFSLPGLKRDALGEAIGNGVPLPMGRAIARAVKEALEDG